MFGPRRAPGCPATGSKRLPDRPASPNQLAFHGFRARGRPEPSCRFGRYRLPVRVFMLSLANGAALIHVPSSGPGCFPRMRSFSSNATAAPRRIGATYGVDEGMNAMSNKSARLSRDIQAKIGEKLALLYVPVLRQDMPQRLSDLSRRLEKPAGSRRASRSTLSRMLEALRRRRTDSENS